MKIEYVYLNQHAEFVKSGNCVYKIGKSMQPNVDRFHQYPEGTSFLFQTACPDCDSYERDLIKIFKKKYKHRSEIGKEYFEGSYVDMINDIMSYCLNPKDKSTIDNKNTSALKNKKRYFCDKCTYSTTIKRDYNNHKDRLIPCVKPPIICNKCNKEFSRNSGLEIHIKNKSCKESRIENVSHKKKIIKKFVTSDSVTPRARMYNYKIYIQQLKKSKGDILDKKIINEINTHMKLLEHPYN